MSQEKFKQKQDWFWPGLASSEGAHLLHKKVLPETFNSADWTFCCAHVLHFCIIQDSNVSKIFSGSEAVYTGHAVAIISV